MILEIPDLLFENEIIKKGHNLDVYDKNVSIKEFKKRIK